MDYYAIGQRIRSRRKQLMLSQEELAEKVGISTTHMSHIETANTKLSLQVLVDISEVLKTSTDSLLFGEKKDTEEDMAKQIMSALSGATKKEQEIMIDVLQATSIALKKHK